MSATRRIAAVSESGTAAVGTRARDGRPVVEPPVLSGAEHAGYYLLDDLLTDEQRALRRRVREFMDQLTNSAFGAAHGVVDGTPYPVCDTAGYVPFGLGYRRCGVGNSEKLPVSSRTLIDDNIGFERGK